MKRLDNKGITLIALVITIILLLILSGVTIATLTRNNGILTRANDAKTNTDIGEEKEAIGIAYNGLKIENEGTGITAEELKQELNRNGRTDVKDVTGENPIIVEFNSGRIYTIDNNGNIEESIAGNYYETDTDITVGGKPVTIPGGATISGITSETDINKGLVIYITNGEEITDWETVKTKYDQFVWVPVEKEDVIAEDMNKSGTVDETDIDLMIEARKIPNGDRNRKWEL